MVPMDEADWAAWDKHDRYEHMEQLELAYRQGTEEERDIANWIGSEIQDVPEWFEIKASIDFA